LIFNPPSSPTALLQNINREFGILTAPSNSTSLLDTLNQFLLQQNGEGRTAVLVIDEAQDLEAPVLEQIRLISNLETDREKLIQIVLVGQPELGQILQRKELRQLNQRIIVRYHLQPMDFSDTVGYITHRLEVAGRRGGAIFSRKALKRIYKYSGGLPRLINAACDRSLLAGYTRDKTRIGYWVASVGIKDMRRNTAPFAQKARLILIPMVVVLAAFLAAGIYLAGRDLSDEFNPSQPVEATEEQTKAPSPITGEELSRAMVAELGKIPEAESARRAFNTLAGLWNAPPIPESGNLNQSKGMEHAALDRNLRLYRFSGNLGALLRIDIPAALELSMPGVRGKRFVSLVGKDNEQLLVDPPIAGRESLSFSELEKHWSGQGFLLWKDPLNLLTRVWPRSRGGHIKRLQDLLREAGAYSRPTTGVYDAGTLLAVKEFQSSRGIAQDGIAGVQTLLLLYRSIDRFEAPRLTVTRK
jgi:general secretion pathway protein A